MRGSSRNTASGPQRAIEDQATSEPGETTTSARQIALASLLAHRQRLEVGQGAITETGVTHGRGAFLDTQARGERSATAELLLVGSYLERLELIHDEPSERGLAASLDRLWASFDDLAGRPGDISRREAVLEQAAATVEQLRRMRDQIAGLRRAAVSEASEVTDRINDLAGEIAELNEAVALVAPSDPTANDILDRRDAALGELADLVAVRVEDREDGTVEVHVGDGELVRGARTVEMTSTLVPDRGLTDMGFERLGIRWVDGDDIVPAGGEAAGLLAVAATTIPDAARDLDSIADLLVATVNSLHSAGRDLDDDTGWDLFEPSGRTADTVAVSADVAGRPRRISAAEVGAGDWDATVAQQIAGRRELVDGPDDRYEALVVGLGVQIGVVRSRASSQTSVSRRVDHARTVAHTVDDETIDLLSAQREYEAYASTVNSVDETLDVLIGRLGLVGGESRRNAR